MMPSVDKNMEQQESINRYKPGTLLTIPTQGWIPIAQWPSNFMLMNIPSKCVPMCIDTLKKSHTSYILYDSIYAKFKLGNTNP